MGVQIRFSKLKKIKIEQLIESLKKFYLIQEPIFNLYSLNMNKECLISVQQVLNPKIQYFLKLFFIGDMGLITKEVQEQLQKLIQIIKIVQKNFLFNEQKKKLWHILKIKESKLY
ncbi:unnamed protein product [Paramecium sonneborni]|uniref:Uncharacterized protein n=1 Tax=Paramecium sonneborni TaxID=65129 RepID=A0A8S1PZC6_9CILI|nr:unnamed protein product [Paramecium sonneborni]